MSPVTDYSKAFEPDDKDQKTLEKCIQARTDAYAEIYDDELWLIFQEEFAS